MNAEQALTNEAYMEVTLEAILLHLAKYGRPRLNQMDSGGWYCCLAVFATGKGVEFRVASEFDQPSPKCAAAQCMDRLAQTLTDIKAISA